MASPQNVRVWPTLDEYDQALRDAATTVYDDEVRARKLTLDCRPLRLNGQSSKYVSVYKMDDWVVKCFFTNPMGKLIITPPPDIDERYQMINDYIHTHEQQLTFLVPQIWVERAININGQVWPFIKSKFIPALTLGVFLADMRQEPFVVPELAKQWLAMINALEQLHMAHGDLDVTNVLVFGAYPRVALRLVDFDSMYVPALYGRTMYEQGHEHFQAPLKLGIRHFNSEMDRFSALVVYLSLVALAEDAYLWDRCKANEETRLLLGLDDFRDLGNSYSYDLLRTKHNNRELQLCLDELASSIYEARTPRNLSDVLSSTPRRRVPTAQLPPQPSPQYIAPPISLPVSFLKPDVSSSPPQPPITIPIPTSYLQSSSSAGQTPSRSRTNPAVWGLLAFAILTVVLAGVAGQPAWLVVTIILLLIMFAVARNMSQ